ncbi:zinc-dependent peptidase [Desulfobotulus sp. H1]|uniref:Zinc-dependent peptidase n=1 Tax=Desulfobotulus pelophilus TaxID=2823377 RepID=A0ABT3NAE8_9BACT|nr:M90 family metallopeptidase [Desulfobotulus pelophilus]MCW7754439.1 zinc-dependent peptidase [Desulfobotulus pelophilus]
MLGKWRDWRRKKILGRVRMDRDLWESVRTDIPILDTIDPDSAFKLRDMASLFMYEKKFEGIQGLETDSFMQAYVATLACIPVFSLGLTRLDNLSSIIMYPSVFISHTEEADEGGIVHQRKEILSGEAWQHGTVVLSWEDVHASGQGSGYNVVIHEVAHILDMGNKEANGFPVLPPSMNTRAWTEAFRGAWKDAKQGAREKKDPVSIDPSALDSPAEFFAVCCEYFFECPQLLLKLWPAVFHQLFLFFDPPWYPSPDMQTK